MLATVCLMIYPQVVLRRSGLCEGLCESVLCTYVTIKIVKFVFAKLKKVYVQYTVGITASYSACCFYVFMLYLHHETLYKQRFVADHFRACDMDQQL